MALDGSGFCAAHPDQRALGRCEQCGKPYCGDCKTEDVAAEKSFCSRECQESWRARDSRDGLVDNHELLAAYATPIRSGWKLWLRCIPRLSLHVLPIAIAMGVVMVHPSFEAIDEVGEPTLTGPGFLIWSGLGAFGVALVQVIMTERHSGLGLGNAYWFTVRRFVPWAVALVLGLALTIVGVLALIFPGIYLSLRLFWAEEFALVHNMGPLAGLRESWKLTQGSAGAIFGFQFLAGLAAYVVMLGVFAAAAVLVASVALLPEAAFGPATGTLMSSGIFCLIFVAYAGIHAPEIVYFYGMKAERAVSLSESTKTLGL